MGERSEVTGWLSLRSEEMQAFIDQIEGDLSTKIEDASHGDVHPLPTPSVAYDIGSALYVAPPAAGTMLAAIDPGDERPDFERLLDDFYARALEALRSLTGPDELVFALDCEHEGYLFWPHKAIPGQPWPLRVPGPEAYFSLYASPDYAWGFFFGWYTAEIWGQPLIDAFDRNKPEILSRVTAIDGVEVERTAPPTEQELAEDRVSRIMFLTGFNYSLCPEGPWTPELKRLHDEFERTSERADLAKLITKIELVLNEQGIEHTPCVPPDDPASGARWRPPRWPFGRTGRKKL